MSQISQDKAVTDTCHVFPVMVKKFGSSTLCTMFHGPAEEGQSACFTRVRQKEQDGRSGGGGVESWHNSRILPHGKNCWTYKLHGPQALINWECSRAKKSEANKRVAPLKHTPFGAMSYGVCALTVSRITHNSSQDFIPPLNESALSLSPSLSLYYYYYLCHFFMLFITSLTSTRC